MKKAKLLSVALICCLSMSAQTVLNTGYLQITLHKQLLLGTCNLDSAKDTIYIHSGPGYLSPTDVWDVVVGHWGIDDGIGEMQTLNDSTYQICMNLTQTTSNYYIANPIDSPVPMPTNATIYNIGCVFRAADGFPTNPNGTFQVDPNLKGGGNDLDSRNQCSDFWLVGVNTDSIGQQVQPIAVWEEDEIALAPAVTVQWVSQSACSTNVGIKDISDQLFDGIKVSPNPFTDNVTVQFNMVPGTTPVHAEVYDVMGSKVADFSPLIKAGYNQFSWDGAGPDGRALSSGTYLIKLSNGSDVRTAKLIKL